MIPKAGRTMMYTSGCPKNQKRVLVEDGQTAVRRVEEVGLDVPRADRDPSVEQEQRERG